MPANTPIVGLPYPLGSDPVRDGDNDIRALADAVEQKAGLWLITSCTATFTGGTAGSVTNGRVTVGNGNTAVTVSNAFSASFDNYKITYSGGSISSTGLIYVSLGSTAANYYGARTASNVSSGNALAADNNASSWTFGGVGNTSFTQVDMEILGPFPSRRTFIQSRYFEGTGALGIYTGYQDSNTSFTSFTLTPQPSRTLTGGVIRVYGYTN